MVGTYRETTPERNPFTPPTLPELRATFAARLKVMGKRNGRWKHGRGTKRRHRREVDSKRRLELIALWASGATTFPGHDGRHWSIAEMLAAHIPKAARFARNVQRHLAAAWFWVRHFGPDAGWGVAQPVPEAGREKKWTPYEVPKQSEACWRWWRNMARAVLNLARMLARALGKPIPLHRALLEQVAERRSEAKPQLLPSTDQTRLRDRAVAEGETAWERCQRRFGM